MMNKRKRGVSAKKIRSEIRMKHKSIQRLEIENESLRKIAVCEDKNYLREKRELEVKLARIEKLKSRKIKLREANKKIKNLIPSIVENTELVKARCRNLEGKIRVVKGEKEKNMRILFGDFLDQKIPESPIHDDKILMSCKLNELRELKNQRRSKIYEILKISKNLKTENFYLDELIKKGKLGSDTTDDFTQKKEELQDLDTLYSLIK